MTEKQVSCDCGEVIREEREEELVRAVKEHADEVHDMDLTREEVLAMARPV